MFIACLEAMFVNFSVCHFTILLLLVHFVMEAVSSGADMSMIGWPSDRAMTFTFRNVCFECFDLLASHGFSTSVKGQFGVGFYSPCLG